MLCVFFPAPLDINVTALGSVSPLFSRGANSAAEQANLIFWIYMGN
jgi:hypothetical protein